MKTNLRTFRPHLVLAVAFAALPQVAHGNAAGLGNYSGKIASLTCANCHTGATPAPTVQISGPSTLAPGAVGNYAVTVTGGPTGAKNAGVGIASDTGTLAPGTGVAAAPGAAAELAQSAPLAFTGNSAEFDFTVTAPQTAGTMTIYASGTSCNGDDAITGDASAATTYAVTIGGSGTGPGGGGGNDAGLVVGDRPPLPPSGGCSTSGAFGLAAFAGLAAALGLRRLQRRA